MASAADKGALTCHRVLAAAALAAMDEAETRIRADHGHAKIITRGKRILYSTAVAHYYYYYSGMGEYDMKKDAEIFKDNLFPQKL